MKKNCSSTVCNIFFHCLSIPYLFTLSCNSVKNQAEESNVGVSSEFTGIWDNELPGNADVLINQATEGGKIGTNINSQMDLQTDELKSALPDVQIKQISEGILITFEIEDLFSSDSYDMCSMVEDKLLPLADISYKHLNTYILIEGHSDKFISEKYNLQLSRKRANTILIYLKSNYIDSERITAIGYTENNNGNIQKSKPNNRIVNAIYANE